jgi:hypothetical protein
VYVYGDDILVASIAAPVIFDWLPRFGMKLNMSKSFYRSHFRESCGIHAWKGKDITPVYFKFTPQLAINSAMSCIAVEQQLYEKQYKHVACLLRNEVRKLHGDLPFVNECSPIFGFKRKDYGLPSNWEQLRTKRDLYGNIQYRVRLVKSVQSMDRPPSDEECYLRKLVTSANSAFIGGEPSDQYVKWQYVNYPQLTGIQLPQWALSLTKNQGDLNETKIQRNSQLDPLCRCNTCLMAKRRRLRPIGSPIDISGWTSPSFSPFLSGWKVGCNGMHYQGKTPQPKINGTYTEQLLGYCTGAIYGPSDKTMGWEPTPFMHRRLRLDKRP